jgi:hypothetical protein
MRWLTYLKGRSRRAKRLAFLIFLLAVCAAGYCAYHRWLPGFGTAAPRPSSNSDSYVGELVPLNLTSDVVTCFRGDVHPLLYGPTKLELTAHWVADSKNPTPSRKFSISANGAHFFLNLSPAQERQIYTARDFSAFLPEKVTGVGQTWSIDPGKVAPLLRQFHAAPSMHLDGEGRRVGPDGAFGILRAVSPSHLDIAIRVHAEFDVSSDLPPELRVKAWYTPAYFSGQMIVNRERGTVEYFRLAIPADRVLNAHLTMKMLGLPSPAPPRGKSLTHLMAHIDRMELEGGNPELATTDPPDALTQAEAERRLQRLYYKFMDVHWLPFDDVLAAAREKHRPILAVVLWGNLDDQSC